MIITNISRSEILRLTQTSFGTRILLCFNNHQDVRFALNNFKHFLQDEQIEFILKQRNCDIEFGGSKLMFKVVSDDIVKENLAGILVSCIVLNDVKLSTSSHIRLQHRCRNQN